MSNSNSVVERSYQAARAFAVKGELDRAAQLYEAFLLEHPNHAQAWIDITEISLITGQYRATYKFAMGLLEKDPTLAAAWLSLGLALEKDDLERAIEALKRAVQEDRTLFLGHFHLARLLGKQEVGSLALEHAQLALSLNPNDLDALFLTGTLYRKLDANKEASSLFSQMIKLDSQRLDAYLSLSELLRYEGQFEFALEILHEALRCSGPSALITEQELALYALLGKKKEAVQTARRLVSRFPKLAQAHLQLGALLLQGGELTEAEGSLKRASQLDSEAWTALHLLGKLYEASGLEKKSESHFQQALKVDGVGWEVSNDLGLLLLGLDRVDEAIELFSHAATLIGSGSSFPLFNMMLACFKGGDSSSVLRLGETLLQMRNLPSEQSEAIKEMMSEKMQSTLA